MVLWNKANIFQPNEYWYVENIKANEIMILKQSFGSAIIEVSDWHIITCYEIIFITVNGMGIQQTRPSADAPSYKFVQILFQFNTRRVHNTA